MANDQDDTLSIFSMSDNGSILSDLEDAESNVLETSGATAVLVEPGSESSPPPAPEPISAVDDEPSISTNRTHPKFFIPEESIVLNVRFFAY